MTTRPFQHRGWTVSIADELPTQTTLVTLQRPRGVGIETFGMRLSREAVVGIGFHPAIPTVLADYVIDRTGKGRASWPANWKVEPLIVPPADSAEAEA